MVPYPFYKITGIIQEHPRIIRVRTVNRIGKPEILPDHNPILVAGIEEFVIAGLAHPVPDHRKVHILMIPDSGIVFSFPVIEVRL